MRRPCFRTVHTRCLNALISSLNAHQMLSPALFERVCASPQVSALIGRRVFELVVASVALSLATWIIGGGTSLDGSNTAYNGTFYLVGSNSGSSGGGGGGLGGDNTTGLYRYGAGVGFSEWAAGWARQVDISRPWPTAIQPLLEAVIEAEPLWWMWSVTFGGLIVLAVLLRLADAMCCSGLLGSAIKREPRPSYVTLDDEEELSDGGGDGDAAGTTATTRRQWQAEAAPGSVVELRDEEWAPSPPLVITHEGQSVQQPSRPKGQHVTPDMRQQPTPALPLLLPPPSSPRMAQARAQARASTAAVLAGSSRTGRAPGGGVASSASRAANGGAPGAWIPLSEVRRL